MMGTVDDEEKLLQYNMRCLIPDVLRWIDGVGFDLRGVEWLQQILFESDAPSQFIIDDDEDDDEDADFEDDNGADFEDNDLE